MGDAVNVGPDLSGYSVADVQRLGAPSPSAPSSSWSLPSVNDVVGWIGTAAKGVSDVVRAGGQASATVQQAVGDAQQRAASAAAQSFWTAHKDLIVLAAVVLYVTLRK